MANLLQHYFFPTDFYYPRTSNKTQTNEDQRQVIHPNTKYLSKVSMAGMQYKFFPTDFLFPLQKSPAATGGGDGSSQAVLPVRSTRDIGLSEGSKQPNSIAMTNGKIVKSINPIITNNKKLPAVSYHSQEKNKHIEP